MVPRIDRLRSCFGIGRVCIVAGKRCIVCRNEAVAAEEAETRRQAVARSTNS